jgi:hypothetical protein
MARKGSQKGDVAIVFAPVTEAHHKKWRTGLHQSCHNPSCKWNTMLAPITVQSLMQMKSYICTNYIPLTGTWENACPVA